MSAFRPKQDRRQTTDRRTASRGGRRTTDPHPLLACPRCEDANIERRRTTAGVFACVCRACGDTWHALPLRPQPH